MVSKPLFEANSLLLFCAFDSLHLLGEGGREAPLQSSQAGMNRSNHPTARTQKSIYAGNDLTP